MSTEIIVLSYVICAVGAAAVVLGSLPFVHMLQLESYQGKMYLKWLKKHIMSDAVSYFFAALVSLLLRCAYVMFAATNTVLANICYTGADIVYVLLLLVFFLSYKKKPAVKKLAYTVRIKRLLAAEFIIAFLFTCSFFITLEYKGAMSWGAYIGLNLIRYLPMLLMPLFVFLAYLVTYPIEEGIKKHYFNDAKKRLADRTDLIKIGITGSFGKTGTKYALSTLLSEKYNVLFTPGSFNTPMGVTRVVREKLQAENEVFIAEMGARYRGDIKELCTLVKPKFGIITSVGKQHLETFGSLDGVISTKFELAQNLDTDGCCFFNADNEYTRELCSRAVCAENYLFGTVGDDLYMKASNISVSHGGSTFTLTDRDGNSTSCTTALLGQHNIVNLCGAAACAKRLGLSLEQISQGIAKCEPVEHRLQLIKGAVTVIDDAFNSNPIGSKEALNIIKSFPGRRIVVTPGMVELGDEENALNREFGRHMASCVDIAIVIGKAHADPICEGLSDGGFDSSCIVRADSLADATEKLKHYTENGCVVLFENDLPDNYKE